MRPIPFDVIRDATLQKLGVPLADFQGDGRMPRAVWARRVVSYLSHRLTGISYPEIALRMGRTGHSSIIDMHNLMAAAIEVFPGLGDDVARIEAEVRSIVADQDAIENRKVRTTDRTPSANDRGTLASAGKKSQPAHVAPR